MPSYIDGNIGGVATPIFVGTPGVPGAQAQNGLQGFFSSIGASPAGQLIGGGATSIGASIIGAFSPEGSTTSNAAAQVVGHNTNITDLFLRGVVIILGFIFVAIGLSMFRDHSTVILQSAGQGARSLGRKVALKK